MSHGITAADNAPDRVVKLANVGHYPSPERHDAFLCLGGSGISPPSTAPRRTKMPASRPR